MMDNIIKLFLFLINLVIFFGSIYIIIISLPLLLTDKSTFIGICILSIIGILYSISSSYKLLDKKDDDEY
jgi:hypothetical protein